MRGSYEHLYINSKPAQKCLSSRISQDLATYRSKHDDVSKTSCGKKLNTDYNKIFRQVLKFPEITKEKRKTELKLSFLLFQEIQVLNENFVNEDDYNTFPFVSTTIFPRSKSFKKQRTEQILSQQDNKYPSRVLSVKFSFFLAIEALMPVYCFIFYISCISENFYLDKLPENKSFHLT